MTEGLQGWQPDTYRRHELRYYSGGKATFLVRDGSSEGADPIDGLDEPPPLELTAPVQPGNGDSPPLPPPGYGGHPGYGPAGYGQPVYPPPGYPVYDYSQVPPGYGPGYGYGPPAGYLPPGYGPLPPSYPPPGLVAPPVSADAAAPTVTDTPAEPEPVVPDLTAESAPVAEEPPAPTAAESPASEPPAPAPEAPAATGPEPANDDAVYAVPMYAMFVYAIPSGANGISTPSLPVPQIALVLPSLSLDAPPMTYASPPSAPAPTPAASSAAGPPPGAPSTSASAASTLRAPAAAVHAPPVEVPVVQTSAMPQSFTQTMVAEPRTEPRPDSMTLQQKVLPPLTFAPRSVRSDPDRPISFATVESRPAPNGHSADNRINGQSLTATAANGGDSMAAPPIPSHDESRPARSPFADDAERRARRRWIMLSSALAVGIVIILGLILMR